MGSTVDLIVRCCACLWISGSDETSIAENSVEGVFLIQSWFLVPRCCPTSALNLSGANSFHPGQIFPVRWLYSIAWEQAVR